MKRIFFHLSLFLSMLLFQSQYTGPNGQNYDNYCTGADPDAMYTFAEAWYNDPDTDCRSNDWIVNLHDGNQVNTIDSDDVGNPLIDFDNLNWDCCDETIGGTGGGSGGSNSCECTWSIEGEVLTIVCCRD